MTQPAIPRQALADVKLAIFDIDGTLARDDAQVSAATCAALGRLANTGVTVVIATGRTQGSPEEILRRAGVPGYVVYLNGALTRHQPTGRVLDISPMNRDLLAQCWDFDTRHRLNLVVFTDHYVYARRYGAELAQVEALFSSERHIFVQNLAEIYGGGAIGGADDDVDSVGDFDLAPHATATTNATLAPHDAPAAHATATTETTDALRAKHGDHPDRTTPAECPVPLKAMFHQVGGDLAHFRSLVLEHFPFAVETAPSFIEVSDPHMSKVHGLEIILQELGLSWAQTLGVGDSENDLRWLPKVGISLCPNTAYDSVKAICDYQIGSHDEDCVADFIDYWLA